MNDLPKDPIHRRIVQGTSAARAVAIERARQTGTLLVVWRDGKVIEISPDDPSLGNKPDKKAV